MSICQDVPIPVSEIPDFWERVRHARHRLLALDYDGTLAPFQIDRMKALPFNGIVNVLSEIQDSSNTRLVIISGRIVEEVLELMGDVHITIIGNHGSEIRGPDGSVRFMPPTPEQRKRMEQAETEVLSLAGMTIRDRIERKLTSIAVHTRGMDTEKAKYIESEIFRIWSEGIEQYSMVCQKFNRGVELRCSDVNKGMAIRNFLEEEMPKDTFCIYIGDDATDEDAFKEIQRHNRGIGIRVGSQNDATAALGYLLNVEAVYVFLKEWVRVTIGNR